MPSYSDDTLFKSALVAAIAETEGFLETVSHSRVLSAHAASMLARFKALHGAKLSGLTEAEQDAAMQAFRYGERKHLRYAQAYPDARDTKKALALAARYQEVRFRRWGKHRFETYLESVGLAA